MNMLIKSRLSPFFIIDKGVGPVKASAICSPPNKGLAFGHSDIATFVGKERNKKTLPTNAGLKGFFPNPPNVILPIPIATNAPIITI